MATDPKQRIVDPEFEIFWREVGEAVHMVELNNVEITVERGNRGAKVGTDPTREQITIYIYEVEPKQPALMVP